MWIAIVYSATFLVIDIVFSQLQWIALCIYNFVLFKLYLQGKFSEVGLFSQKVNSCIVLLNIAKFPSVRTVPFAFPSAIYDSAYLSTASPAVECYLTVLPVYLMVYLCNFNFHVSLQVRHNKCVRVILKLCVCVSVDFLSVFFAHFYIKSWLWSFAHQF